MTKRNRKGMQTIVINGPLNEKSQTNIKKLNDYINSGKHIFLFLFMVGCGPCNETKGPWSKIHHHLESEYLQNPNIVVSMVDKDFYPKLMNVGKEPMGFPTLRYINNGVEDYEDCQMERKDRSAESFADWIKIKVSKMKGGARDHRIPKSLVRTTPTRRRAGGKWSLKYKRSINCKRPKGFSQKQHCKYGRRKTRKNKKI
jgi:hypothetical protein